MLLLEQGILTPYSVQIKVNRPWTDCLPPRQSSVVYPPLNSSANANSTPRTQIQCTTYTKPLHLLTHSSPENSIIFSTPRHQDQARVQYSAPTQSNTAHTNSIAATPPFTINATTLSTSKTHNQTAANAAPPRPPSRAALSSESRLREVVEA